MTHDEFYCAVADYKESQSIKHFGIKGQKHGIRRFQREDGTLTPEGKMRYSKSDSSVTKKVKSNWNTLSDDDFKKKYSVSKKEYARRVKKYGDPYMNSPYAKAGKKLAEKRRARIQKRRQKLLNRTRTIILDGTEYKVHNMNEKMRKKYESYKRNSEYNI